MGAVRSTSTTSRRRAATVTAVVCLSLLGSPSLAPAAHAVDPPAADVLQLDQRLTADLPDALAGEDLEEALGALDGVDLVPDGDPNRITFTYARSADDVELPLVHDDGDLRFGPNDGAGSLDVSLTTRAAHPFVVEVDEDQEDPPGT